jgi:hypothetical protein
MADVRTQNVCADRRSNTLIWRRRDYLAGVKVRTFSQRRCRCRKFLIVEVQRGEGGALLWISETTLYDKA